VGPSDSQKQKKRRTWAGGERRTSHGSRTTEIKNPNPDLRQSRTFKINTKVKTRIKYLNPGERRESWRKLPVPRGANGEPQNSCLS